MERHNTTKGPTYQVHLRNDARVDLDSPLETNRIDFFDAGIWLFQAGERLFLP